MISLLGAMKICQHLKKLHFLSTAPKYTSYIILYGVLQKISLMTSHGDWPANWGLISIVRKGLDHHLRFKGTGLPPLSTFKKRETF